MSRVDVCWLSNPPDKFLTVQNNEMALYKMERVPIGGSEKRQLNSLSTWASDHSLATILTQNTEIEFVKTFDCHPSAEHENLVAVGHANGRVLLTSPFASSSDPWLGREFVPKHGRSCLSLAWNVKHPSLLAIGFDRHRADNSVYIWDLTSKTQTFGLPESSSSANVHDHTSISGSIEHRRALSIVEYGSTAVPPTNVSSLAHHSRALYELAPSESAASLTWLRQSPRVLVCGLSAKYIRLFDLRDTSKAQTTIQTKAVHGLTLDPFNENRLCSFYDNQIMLWDLRQTDKPLLIMSEQKSIIKIQWDPVRKNVLSSLCRDSSSVRVYHLHQIVHVAAVDAELSFVETFIQPRHRTSSTTPSSIVSYAWHPSDENRLLAVGLNSDIYDVSICERLCVDWNGDGDLISSFPKHFVEHRNLRFSPDRQGTNRIDEDISSIMKSRALNGYGIGGAADSTFPVFRRAAEVCKDDPDLRYLWTWLEKMKNISTEDAETWAYDLKFPGALHMFRSPFGRLNASNTEYRSIFGLDAAGHSLMTRLYVSAERDRLLQLCGWCSMIKERSALNDHLIDSLIADGEVERAAAIALFTLRMKLAVQILTNASLVNPAKKYLQLVALSLAGFSGAAERESYLSGTGAITANTSSTNALLMELCSSVLPTVDNPHLKAMFLFLTNKYSSTNSYEGVLETDLPVYDKIAFSAVHLPDSNFVEVLEQLYRQCLASANILGLIVCGFGSEQTLEILESYVDRTADVQTAAILLLATGSSQRPAQQTIVEQNNISEQNNPLQIVPQDQIFTSKRTDEIVGAYLDLLNRWCLWHARAQTEMLMSKSDDKSSVTKLAPQVYLTCTYCSKSVWSNTGRARQRMNKLGSCPNCKKPLPRCSLCRFHMGVQLHDEGSKVNKFATWFSWCQTCRHGGHAQHLTEWFQDYDDCPVTGCSCKCASLDSSCGDAIS